jgi:hypothetical protein
MLMKVSLMSSKVGRLGFTVLMFLSLRHSSFQVEAVLFAVGWIRCETDSAKLEDLVETSPETSGFLDV